jgi:hypothetical protein
MNLTMRIILYKKYFKHYDGITQFTKLRFMSLRLDSITLRPFDTQLTIFFPPFHISFPQPYHLICYGCYLTPDGVVVKRYMLYLKCIIKSYQTTSCNVNSVGVLSLYWFLFRYRKQNVR